MGRISPVGVGNTVATQVIERGRGKDVLVTSEAGPPVASPAATHRVATDYIHTTHPDRGFDVVFVPGETIPDWVTIPE